jgi:cell division transport system permease protein
MTRKNRRIRKKHLGSYPFLTVLLSLILALFVLGLCGLLLWQGNRLSRSIQENIEVYVYLDHELAPPDLARIDSQLKQKNYLLRKNNMPQVQFISKEAAAQKFMAEAGEDFISFLGENPLRDLYAVKINPDFFQKEQLKAIQSEIEKIPGVFEVVYQENLIDEVQRNIRRIAWVLVAFAVVLLATIVILINNTIKLAMFSQRFLIRSMQLVGATAPFIRRPFLLRAAGQGALGGVMASGLLWGVLQYANSQVEGLSALQDSVSLGILFLIIVLAGSGVGVASAYFSVNRYLEMPLEELY